MAEQAAVSPSPSYVSENSEKDFQRLKAALRRVVSVPKEAVDTAITEEAAQKKQRKEEARNG